MYRSEGAGGGCTAARGLVEGILQREDGWRTDRGESAFWGTLPAEVCVEGVYCCNKNLWGIFKTVRIFEALRLSV